MRYKHRIRPSGYLRRIVQILSLLLFLYLLLFTRETFIDMEYRVASPIPSNFFFRTDPLLFVSLILTVKGFVYAAFLPMAVLLVLSVIFGRFFCGWICPLGTILDFMPRAVSTKEQNPKQPPGHSFKYYFLIVLLILAVFGANIVGLFDPITILFRSLAYSILPYFDYMVRGTLGLLSQLPVIGRIAGGMSQSYSSIVGVTPRVHLQGWLYLLIFLAILLLIRVQLRYWCRYLCPLGAMLGVISRISLFRRKVTDACTQCGICEQVCRMNCIGNPAEINAHQDCIMCLECSEVCPVDAIRFSPFARKSRAIDVPIDWEKRKMIKAVAAAVVAFPLLRVAVGRNEQTRNPYLLRPPGALPEEQFLDTCVRCGQCIKVCPENALQPALFQATLEGMGTPLLVPRIGYCALDCTLCGRVCPTGAIQQLTALLKRTTVIGWAYFDRNRCLSWLNRQCNVCEEACPQSPKAIITRRELYIDEEGNEKAIMRPYVVEERCIGCGNCENVCPLEGEAAIRVRRIPESTRRTYT